MAKEEARETKDYYNVLSDGKFHLTVPNGTEGAVVREYETSTGEKGSKTEKVFNSVSGLIKSVEFYDGSYGKNLILNMEDEDGAFAISFGCATNFGEDVLKKILNIDMSKEVKLTPYSFIDDVTKKSKKGVSITQGDEKITSYFHDYDGDTKKTTVKYGYPKTPTKKNMSSDEWKLYFMTARLFMIDKVAEKFPQTEKSDDKDF